MGDAVTSPHDILVSSTLVETLRNYESSLQQWDFEFGACSPDFGFAGLLVGRRSTLFGAWGSLLLGFGFRVWG